MSSHKIPKSHRLRETSSSHGLLNPQKPPEPSRKHKGQLTSFSAYLRDQSYLVVAATTITLLGAIFLYAFKVSLEVVLTLAALWLTFLIFVLLTGFFRKVTFYRSLLHNIAQLDQAYLVLETLSQPKFYDGAILHEALYQINKSMLENVNRYRLKSQAFQEYVELWIHEVKTPLATLSLMSHDPKINEQIKHMDDYVEQILYFARAENAEQDYLIHETSLASIVNSVALRNREILQAKPIDFIARDLDYAVFTDAKWLEFVLNQILANSIKYSSRRIEISASDHPRSIALHIQDDGIGISAKDLPRVFDKSFTGQNGRRGATSHHSTGMGLYLAKMLCTKLGHDITIDSHESKWTKLTITFAKHDYYNVSKPPTPHNASP